MEHASTAAARGAATGHARGSEVTGEVIAAILVLGVALLPALLVLPHDRVVLDASLLLLGWLPVGIAGVLCLDRMPRSRLGWSAVLTSALTPTVMLLATLTSSEPATTLGPAGLAPLLAVAMAACTASGRSARRWRVWIIAWCGGTVAAGFIAWQWGTPSTFGLLATLGLLAVACSVAASSLAAPPRPVVEPLTDLGLIAGVLLTSALVGTAVWAFARHERVFAADVVGTLAATVTIVMTSPLALAVRRAFVARRYGPGTLSPDDLSALTGGLTRDRDPRELLTTAGELVALASGTPAVDIVLDDLEDRAHWSTHPLLVGDDRVGSMAVRHRDEEGLEVRQERVVAQLAPTVALVARAVALAVDAQHARSDVQRERDRERSRILADLHDDLGPSLAGMGMRVAAMRSTAPSPELSELAHDLAACRADLRRIVSAITPGPLVDADLVAALTTLVASFQTSSGPVVRLDAQDAGEIDGELAVLAYRFVAEGVTNSLRHAAPREVVVRVTTRAGRMCVTVQDDGRGGPVSPGVGLTSLRSRARDVGGEVRHEDRRGGGLLLTLRVPGGPT